MPASSYDIARRDYYSPLPDFDAVPQEVWDSVSPMRGIEFDVDAQFAWAQANLSDHVKEFDPPAHGNLQAPEFFLFNWSFQAVDAEFLYAIVRHAKPARIIELGPGSRRSSWPRPRWPTTSTGLTPGWMRSTRSRRRTSRVTRSKA